VIGGLVCLNGGAWFAAEMSALERARQGSIAELIKTEEAYIKDMQIVHEVCPFPLNFSFLNFVTP
jgi:hypothetical protein